MKPLLALAAGLLAFSAASVAVAADPSLTISYSEQTADMIPLWIAADAGYFKQHGLDATVRYLPAQQGIPALIAGQIQMASIGGSDAISAVAQGAQLKFVLTLTPVYTFQIWALPQYAKPEALKGQRVGIPSMTGSAYAATLLALKQLGLSTSDVILTPLGSVSNVNNALLAGSIAAAASHAPPTYQFEKSGYHDLVDLAQKQIPSISAGILVPEAYIVAHRDIVQRAVDALVEALQREKSDRAFTNDEMRKYMKVTDKAVADFTYDFYAKEVVGNPLPEAAELQSNKESLVQRNPKVAAVDISAMVDQSFATAAMK